MYSNPTSATFHVYQLSGVRVASSLNGSSSQSIDKHIVQIAGSGVNESSYDLVVPFLDAGTQLHVITLPGYEDPIDFFGAKRPPPGLRARFRIPYNPEIR